MKWIPKPVKHMQDTQTEIKQTAQETDTIRVVLRKKREELLHKTLLSRLENREE